MSVRAHSWTRKRELFFWVTQYEIIHTLELRMLCLIEYEICNFLLFLFGYNCLFINHYRAFRGKSDISEWVNEWERERLWLCKPLELPKMNTLFNIHNTCRKKSLEIHHSQFHKSIDLLPIHKFTWDFINLFYGYVKCRSNHLHVSSGYTMLGIIHILSTNGIGRVMHQSWTLRLGGLF